MMISLFMAFYESTYKDTKASKAAGGKPTGASRHRNGSAPAAPAVAGTPNGSGPRRRIQAQAE